MKGFVPTPEPVVDLMVGRLFEGRPPRSSDLVLDPGCGAGEFIAGVLRWAEREGTVAPRVLGVELHPGRAAAAREAFRDAPSVMIREADFLEGEWPNARFVIGNPPYVPITQLSADEKDRYRERFATAVGRFDLYALFFEHALRSLADDGRLVFVTPEKYLSVGAARPLRQLLARTGVSEVSLLPENAFPGHVTYPAVTVVEPGTSGETTILARDGSRRTVTFPDDGASIAAAVRGRAPLEVAGPTLGDVTRRVSCGVATGADRVFVRPAEGLAAALLPFARPTVSGRQLTPGRPIEPVDVMLTPYDVEGRLLGPEALGALGDELRRHEARLLKRTCVQRKPWYAFHETPPLSDLLRPKLLCKDVAHEPRFWIDRTGEIVPRHSVYYVVPKRPETLDALAEVLNATATARWLRAHAQPAANGYRRLQSSVLKRIPMPRELAEGTPDLFSRAA